MELKTTKEIVESILEKKEKARESDELLICLVYKALGRDWTIPFGQMMSIVASQELPAFETISRCRRKLQQDREELRGSNYTERLKKEPEYEALAKGEI